ncbi:MAG: hypothetical protein ACP5GZ_11415 [Vulcanisaeta sp.]|uniref:hypothetical protein n=1 Tax=Vulcanisaeta sp. TaxID=2020871 RepID=UPI003D0C43CC
MSVRLMVLTQLLLIMVVFSFLYYVGVTNVNYYFFAYTIIYILTAMIFNPTNRRMRIINVLVMGILITVSLILISIYIYPILMKPPTQYYA